MTPPSVSTIEQILELARWAPSGDNSQPWRFRIVGPQHVDIIGRDQAEHDVYDFDGKPTLLSLGFLLETVAIAASVHGWGMDWSYSQLRPHVHLIQIQFRSADAVAADPLLEFVTQRSVARGSYQRRELTQAQRMALEQSLGPELVVQWWTRAAQRWQIGRLNALATHIRLSIPEAYAVHRRILDWENARSPAQVPAASIGLNPVALKAMRWVMQDWQRVHRMNRFAGGTVMPRVEMDLLPALNCGAHFMIFPSKDEAQADAPTLLRQGRALQRFWLSASAHGLVMQPSLAPLCFAYYAKEGRDFTTDQRMRKHAAQLATALQAAWIPVSRVAPVFMGRVGSPLGAQSTARSVRLPLAQLMIPEGEQI